MVVDLTPVVQNYFSFKAEHLLPAFFTVMIPVLFVYYFIKHDLKKGAIIAFFSAGILTTVFFFVMYYRPDLYNQAKVSWLAYAVIVAALSSMSTYVVSNFTHKDRVPDVFYIYVFLAVALVELLAYNLLNIPVMAVFG